VRRLFSTPSVERPRPPCARALPCGRKSTQQQSTTSVWCWSAQARMPACLRRQAPPPRQHRRGGGRPPPHLPDGGHVRLPLRENRGVAARVCSRVHPDGCASRVCVGRRRQFSEARRWRRVIRGRSAGPCGQRAFDAHVPCSEHQLQPRDTCFQAPHVKSSPG